HQTHDFNRRILKTVRPVVWEGVRAQSRTLDPICPFLSSVETCPLYFVPILRHQTHDFNRRILKTVRPVVWEGVRAQSRTLDPICPFLSSVETCPLHDVLLIRHQTHDFNRRILKTVRPVVWEGVRAQSRTLDPIYPFLSSAETCPPL